MRSRHAATRHRRRRHHRRTAASPVTEVRAVANLTHNEGSAVNLSLASLFKDPEGDAITLTLGGLPGWATYDAATKTISGTPGSGSRQRCAAASPSGRLNGGRR